MRDEQSFARPVTTPFFTNEIGYVQHLDAAALAKIADQSKEVDLVIVAMPGKLPPARPRMLRGSRRRGSFWIGPLPASIGDDVRSFDQDRRFVGASVLTSRLRRFVSCRQRSGTCIVHSTSFRARCEFSTRGMTQAQRSTWRNRLSPQLHVRRVGSRPV